MTSCTRFALIRPMGRHGFSLLAALSLLVASIGYSPHVRRAAADAPRAPAVYVDTTLPTQTGATITSRRGAMCKPP